MTNSFASDATGFLKKLKFFQNTYDKFTPSKRESGRGRKIEERINSFSRGVKDIYIKEADPYTR